MFGNFWYCGLESAGNTTSFLHLPIKSPPWRNIFKCKEPTKMNVVFSLLSLLGLLATSQAFVSQGFCDGADLGAEMVEESWECDVGGGASCSRVSTSCSCDGKSIKQGGTNIYDSRGELYTATGGWDCHNKCRGSPGSSGAQAKSSKKSCDGGATSFFDIGSGPIAGQQEGEECGSCYCPPDYTAGVCGEGLTCVKESSYEDLPGVCRRTHQ